MDGFIVTVYKGQKPVVEEAPTKSFDDEDTDAEENSTEDAEASEDSSDESSDGENY